MATVAPPMSARVARHDPINFKIPEGMPHNTIRLYLSDGSFIDVAAQKGGQTLLDVSLVFPGLKQHVTDMLALYSGNRSHVSVDEARMVTCKLDRRHNCFGKEPFVQIFLDGAFLRVVRLPVMIVDEQFVHLPAAVAA